MNLFHVCNVISIVKKWHPVNFPGFYWNFGNFESSVKLRVCCCFPWILAFWVLFALCMDMWFFKCSVWVCFNIAVIFEIEIVSGNVIFFEWFPKICFLWRSRVAAKCFKIKISYVLFFCQTVNVHLASITVFCLHQPRTIEYTGF